MNNDSVFSGGREAQRVERSHVCQGTSKTFKEKVILGLSPQKYVSVREGDPSRQREQHEHKYGGMKLQGPLGKVSKQLEPRGYLGSRVGQADNLPTPWLSHGYCVQLGMKKYIDLCWFCMTFDLSHN